jgi:hypothetical protein
VFTNSRITNIELADNSKITGHVNIDMSSNTPTSNNEDLSKIYLTLQDNAIITDMVKISITSIDYIDSFVLLKGNSSISEDAVIDIDAAETNVDTGLTMTGDSKIRGKAVVKGNVVLSGNIDIHGICNIDGNIYDKILDAGLINYKYSINPIYDKTHPSHIMIDCTVMRVDECYSRFWDNKKEFPKGSDEALYRLRALNIAMISINKPTKTMKEIL